MDMFLLILGRHDAAIQWHVITSPVLQVLILWLISSIFLAKGTHFSSCRSYIIPRCIVSWYNHRKKKKKKSTVMSCCISNMATGQNKKQLYCTNPSMTHWEEALEHELVMENLTRVRVCISNQERWRKMSHFSWHIAIKMNVYVNWYKYMTWGGRRISLKPT